MSLARNPVSFHVADKPRARQGQISKMSQLGEMRVALQRFQLNKHFGGIHATDDVSLSIERGARHALIGPNGAGKTTLINLLTGVLTPTSGRILLDGEDISDKSTHERVRLG